MEVTVYTIPRCPRCKVLKDWLDRQKIEYKEESLDNVDVVSSLLLEGIFFQSAPGLRVGNRVLDSTDLFSDNKLNSKLIFSLFSSTAV